MPGPIPSEPIVMDGGRDWISLTWGKAETKGPAPVIAYKVDAWLLGGEGGARWIEVRQNICNLVLLFSLPTLRSI